MMPMYENIQAGDVFLNDLPTACCQSSANILILIGAMHHPLTLFPRSPPPRPGLVRANLERTCQNPGDGEKTRKGSTTAVQKKARKERPAAGGVGGVIHAIGP